jgi:hypothetical protein
MEAGRAEGHDEQCRPNWRGADICADHLRPRREGVPEIERSEIWQIQSAVLSRQGTICDVVDQRRLQDINMEMEDIELVDPLPDLLQHDDMVN